VVRDNPYNRLKIYSDYISHDCDDGLACIDKLVIMGERQDNPIGNP